MRYNEIYPDDDERSSPAPLSGTQSQATSVSGANNNNNGGGTSTRQSSRGSKEGKTADGKANIIVIPRNVVPDFTPPQPPKV
jgi:hypothetical protein